MVALPQLPSTLESIDDYTFYGCSALVSIVIPDKTVIRNPESTFEGCTGLQTIASPMRVADYFRASNLEKVKRINQRVAVLLSLKVHQQIEEGVNNNHELGDRFELLPGHLNGPRAFRKLTFGYNEMWRTVLAFL